MRAVLVTGASTGIGAASAVALAEAGFVVHAGVRNDADARRLAALHERIRPLHLDVTDGTSIGDALETVRAGDDALVGLVNNAGIAGGGPLESVPLDDLRHVFEVNVMGAVAVTQAFLPLLRARPSRIVFVGSVSGRVSFPYIAPYSASKFALRALADALRVELAPAQIFVSLIEPGSVVTPIWQKGRAMREAMLERLRPDMPAYYRDATEAVIRGLEGEERNGMPVDRVARAIVETLTAAKPKAHRLMGATAKIGALIALLPAALHDRFLRATMRLP